MVTHKTNVAFTTSSKRFGRITVHPNLDPSGLYTERPPACDPCYYNPIRLHELCAVTHKRGAQKDPWRYKTELEAWAANLGYRNQKILTQRRYDKSIRGPAWHTVPDPPKYVPACPNVMFGRTSRQVKSRSFTPGPGTYYKEKPFKAPYGPHSSRPTFDREEPCRFKDTTPKWSLAPDRYRIIDKESIAEKPNKLVSLRGPYDLFTGSRSKVLTKRVSAATWPIALKGCLETYKKSRFGEMNKTGMDKPHRGRNTLVDLNMCIRRPSDPGPASYTVIKPKVFKQNPRGFNSSYDKPPGYQRVIVWPGVGRYRFAHPHPIEGHGHKHVFLSKIGRTIGSYLPEPLNSF